MHHTMRLNHEPFQKIASGKKKSELRLNDEKRQLIQVGDTIEFSNRANLQQKIIVKVTYLNPHTTFMELFKSIAHDYPNLKQEAFLKAMYKYYTPEDEANYGALEIGIQLLDNSK